MSGYKSSILIRFDSGVGPIVPWKPDRARLFSPPLLSKRVFSFSVRAFSRSSQFAFAKPKNSGPG